MYTWALRPIDPSNVNSPRKSPRHPVTSSAKRGERTRSSYSNPTRITSIRAAELQSRSSLHVTTQRFPSHSTFISRGKSNTPSEKRNFSKSTISPCPLKQAQFNEWNKFTADISLATPANFHASADTCFAYSL